MEDISKDAPVDLCIINLCCNNASQAAEQQQQHSRFVPCSRTLTPSRSNTTTPNAIACSLSHTANMADEYELPKAVVHRIIKSAVRSCRVCSHEQCDRTTIPDASRCATVYLCICSSQTTYRSRKKPSSRYNEQPRPTSITLQLRTRSRSRSVLHGRMHVVTRCACAPSLSQRANECCQENNRSTISQGDVQQALADINLDEFEEVLTQSLAGTSSLVYPSLPRIALAVN